MALFVTRSTRVLDNVGPTAPTIVATPASTTTITINRSVAATDVSGIQYYETQRSPAGAGSWTTFDNSNTNPLTAAGLTEATAYDFRQRAIDTVGNIGTFSTTATATTQSSTGGGVVGQVGPYSALNLATNPISSIDMSAADYSIFATQGAPSMVGTPTGIAGSGNSTHVASAWPLGGTGYCRINPPTTSGFERGIYVGNLWRNASLAIQELNYRFEWRVSPNFFAYNGDGSKFSITHVRRTLTLGSPDDRPVIFLQKCNQHGGQYDRANTAVFGPACTTVAGYCPNEYGDTYVESGGTVDYYLTCPWTYYMVNSGDSGTFQGAPKIQAGEVITIEHRLVSKAIAGYPRGLLAIRVYRENGDFFQKGIPWNWDTNIPLNGYMYEIQQFGMGQWNTAPGANAEYADVGGIITIARDLSTLRPDLGGWLGRRAGAS